MVNRKVEEVEKVKEEGSTDYTDCAINGITDYAHHDE
jgi:hypothetical protein